MRHSPANLAGALGVTGAFSLGSIAVTLVLALVPGVGESSYTGTDVSDWFDVGARLLAYAVLFGLVVDAIRFAARILWRRKPGFAPSLTDLVNMELS